MFLSYSASKYLDCERRFYYYQKFKVGTLPTASLEFGSKAHEDVERRLKEKTPANNLEKYLLDLISIYDEVHFEYYKKSCPAV